MNNYEIFELKPVVVAETKMHIFVSTRKNIVCKCETLLELRF